MNVPEEDRSLFLGKSGRAKLEHRDKIETLPQQDGNLFWKSWAGFAKQRAPKRKVREVKKTFQDSILSMGLSAVNATPSAGNAKSSTWNIKFSIGNELHLVQATPHLVLAMPKLCWQY